MITLLFCIVLSYLRVLGLYTAYDINYLFLAFVCEAILEFVAVMAYCTWRDK